METLEKEQKSVNYHHGHAIKRLRRDNQLTQKELGELIGLTQQTVGRCENEKELDEDMLERFAKGLKVSPDFIKELDDEKPLSAYIENNTFTNSSSNISIGVGTYNSQENVAVMNLILNKLDESYKTTINACNEMILYLKNEIVELKGKISQQENIK